MSRFIIEGTWDGQVVHRSVHPESSKVLRAWAEKLGTLALQDGTHFLLSVRDLGADEKAEATISQYGNLIADCARHDVDSVDALIAAERAA